MSRADADANAAAMAALAEAALAADAMHLSGAEVRAVRDAIARAATALGNLNTRGLPFARRRQVELARSSIAHAGEILARTTPSAAPPPAGPCSRECQHTSGNGGAEAG